MISMLRFPTQQLVEQRLVLLRSLAESLESSTLALARNDAEAIARGAAHQAELCRHWSGLEDELHRESGRRLPSSPAGAPGNSLETEHSAQLQAEWETLGTRIRYLTRVHWSLLRHLERSLAVLDRVVGSCAPTYTPDPGWLGQKSGFGLENNYVRFERVSFDCPRRALGQPAGAGNHFQQRGQREYSRIRARARRFGGRRPSDLWIVRLRHRSGHQKIESLRDPILEIQLNQETQQQSARHHAGQLQQIQTQFGSASSGIGADISNFFNSLQQLAPDPSNLALRQSVLTAAGNLANDFNTTAGNLRTQRSNLDLDVEQSVSGVKTLTTQIASVNQQISALRRRARTRARWWTSGRASSGSFQD